VKREPKSDEEAANTYEGARRNLQRGEAATSEEAAKSAFGALRHVR
jgi:hypothetical protein